MSEDDAGTFSNLRERALAALNPSSADADELPEETTQLIQDLRVYQVELELQNEELYRANEALEKSRRRYRELYDHAPVPYITMDSEGIIVKGNFLAAELLNINREDLLGQPFSRFVAPNSQDVFFLHFKTLFKMQAPLDSKLELIRANDQTFWARLQSRLVQDRVSESSQGWTVINDITARTRSEIAEREQRALARALRDTALALTSTLNLDDVLDRILVNVRGVVSHDAASILLVREDGMAEVVRHINYEDGILDDLEFRISDYPVLERMYQRGEPVLILDTTTRPDWFAERFHTSKFRSYIGVPLLFKGKVRGFLNLHAAKWGFFNPMHIERLLAFADHAVLAIESAQLLEKSTALAALEERQRLARNLHDAVSQTLFSAGVITEALPDLWERHPDKARERLSQLGKLIRGARAEMRSLLLELRPGALMEAKIEDLMNHLVNAVRGRTEMDVSLEVSCPVPLPAEVHMAVYYIVQEALSNIVKHSRATKVSVQLDYRPDECLQVSVQDDGIGFDFGEIGSTALGVNIMRERAEAVGGRLKIVSFEGEGTLIVMSWPAEEESQ